MISRWGPVLVVVATVLVLAGGITVTLLAGQSNHVRPATGNRTSSALYLTAVPPRSGLPSATSVPRPSPRPKPRRLTNEETGCRVGQGPATLSAVPQAVTERVNRGWERIEKWLAAHAPATSLAPPATLAQIAEMQRQIGVAVPAELVASLLRHDGAGQSMRTAFTFPPFYNPISAKEIIGEVHSLCDVLASLGETSSVGWWWHGQWVPFAVDGSGENLVLDQRPGHGGRLGEHDNEGDVMFDRWPRTLTELLEQTADALETGHTILGYCRARVTPEGTLDWELIR